MLYIRIHEPAKIKAYSLLRRNTRTLSLKPSCSSNTENPIMAGLESSKVKDVNVQLDKSKAIVYDNAVSTHVTGT